MARQVDLIATSNGTKYLEFGFNASELASFKLQMWITKYGARAVDWLNALSLGYVGYMGGDLYLFNSDTADRLTLFGEKKDCIIGVIANQNPTIVKILDSIGLDTDGTWEVESVVIPATLNYPDGMYSKIPASMFVRREGISEAEFLRNMKTTSSTISPIDAINGEPLRGHEAYIRLKNTSTSRVRIFKVLVNMTKSR